MLEYLLLGVLLQRPQTGYELKKFMDVTGRFWRASTAMTQVYRSLRKMEKRGWVVHRVEERPGAHDAKRYWATPEGETVFLEWLSEPYVPAEIGRPASPDFLPRLRFAASFLGVEVLLRLLDAEIQARQVQMARFRNRDRTEEIDPTAPFDEELTNLVLEWEHRRGAAMIDEHLRRCIDLRSMLASGDIDTSELPQLLRRIPVSRSDDLGVSW